MPLNRRRKSLRKPSATHSAKDFPTDHTSLDRWLSRGSHIAQVGLFALTIAALFYTVIPLYKTAALEEQIARREVDLKASEIKLAAAEIALVEVSEKVYRRTRADLLWNISSQAVLKCSGLLRPVEELTSGEDPTNLRLARPLLDANVGECLVAELDRFIVNSNLTPRDSQFLREAVLNKSDLLEKGRSKALLSIQSMEEKTTEELRKIAPKGAYTLKADQWLAKVHLIYPELKSQHVEREHRAAMQGAKEKVAMDFEKQVRVEILELREVAWPQPGL